MEALRRGAEEKIGGEESGLRLDFPFSKGSSGPGVHRGESCWMEAWGWDRRFPGSTLLPPGKSQSLSKPLQVSKSTRFPSPSFSSSGQALTKWARMSPPKKYSEKSGRWGPLVLRHSRLGPPYGMAFLIRAFSASLGIQNSPKLANRCKEQSQAGWKPLASNVRCFPFKGTLSLLVMPFMPVFSISPSALGLLTSLHLLLWKRKTNPNLP